MSDRRPVTLREIAAKAGVSVNSVSRALRNARKVSKVKAERIRAIAAEMGYEMNPFLSTWMRQMRRRQQVREREVIALIAFANYTQAPWFTTFKTGTEAFASRSGYRIELFIQTEHSSTASLFRVLRNRGIRGLILAPLLESRFPEEAWQHAVVSLSEPHMVKKIEIVDADHYTGMDLCLRKLTGYGYNRIAYWASVLAVDAHLRWEAAYRLFQKSISTPNRLPVLDLGDIKTLARLTDWVRRYRPDAIICPNNHIYDHVRTNYPQILDEADWVSLNREGHSMLAGVDVHGDSLGEVAARMITRKIELNEIGPPDFGRSVLVQPEWFDGEILKVPNSGQPSAIQS